MLGIPRNSLKLHTCSSLSDHWLLITKTWWYNIIINTSNVDIKLWDNYALLQIISEYFSAFGRSLNCVKISKNPSSSVELEHASKKPPSWIWMLVNPGNEFAITYDAMLWKVWVISTIEGSWWSYFYSRSFYWAKCFLKATESGTFGSRNNTIIVNVKNFITILLDWDLM